MRLLEIAQSTLGRIFLAWISLARVHWIVVRPPDRDHQRIWLRGSGVGIVTNRGPDLIEGGCPLQVNLAK